MNLNLDIFRIKTNNLAPQKGRVLISEPFLSGSYFNRAIIFLVDHGIDGSVGFILNKLYEQQLPDFSNHFPDFHVPIFIGGPVSTDSLYYIHTLGEHIPNSIHISDNLYWGGDFEHMKDLINSGFVHPSQVRFFLGYSGWGKDQLNEELNENSWLVSDINPKSVMVEQDLRWKTMVKNMGGPYTLWENYPENPRFN